MGDEPSAGAAGRPAGVRRSGAVETVSHATFATADQQEGMAAFAEKRPARFEHR
ncbi:hypothetical protein [Kitasatospora sp. NPDC056184]|uniref:hypothetical protein n=1 Tax=Kitasatospora sp. NPDC056184 TaxID=3345738 RepID=UPI0035D670D4